MEPRVINEEAQNLLDRGKFALEDGQFPAAIGFFERALDKDAHCAPAYLGKLLAQTQCKSLTEYTKKRLQMTASAQPVMLPLQENTAHINEMVENHAVEPLFSKAEIRQMYAWDLSYASCLPIRQNQRQQEERLWAENPLLKRAEQLADGAFAQELAQAKQDYFALLDERITDAQITADANASQKLMAYEQFLQSVDQQVVARSHQCFLERDALYDRCLQGVKSSTVAELEQTMHTLNRLGDYKDSKALAAGCAEKIQEIKTAKSKKAKKDMLFSLISVVVLAIVAVLVFTVVIPAVCYRNAEKQLAAGNYDKAITMFEDLGDYKDAADQAKRIRMDLTQRDSVDAGHWHTVGLKADGTVVAVGSNDDGQCDVSTWTDIVAISTGRIHTVGLKADGTVVAAGNNKFNQCDVGDWTDIVAISAGRFYTVGLKANGTVVAVGDNDYGQCDVSAWTDIVAISAGSNHTVGLKADGTVVAVGNNADGQCDVSAWTDIVAISAGAFHTVGLKADGTVVAVGSNIYGLRDVSGWTDIVAISAGTAHTVGLKTDGTVVAVGSNIAGRCNVSGWTDIVAISAGDNHTVGLKADGTVVAVGRYDEGQRRVADWKDILLPEDD